MNKKYVLIAIGYIITIVVLAMNTSLNSVNLVTNFDKALHVVEFFILFLLVAKALEKTGISVLVCFGVALVSEFLQYFIPLRSFSYYDMLADFFGIFIGVIGWKLFKQ
jgi:VanZ family protein